MTSRKLLSRQDREKAGRTHCDLVSSGQRESQQRGEENVPPPAEKQLASDSCWERRLMVAGSWAGQTPAQVQSQDLLATQTTQWGGGVKSNGKLGGEGTEEALKDTGETVSEGQSTSQRHSRGSLTFQSQRKS